MTAPAVVLVGPPGAGKTTVGRLVAEALGVGFRDTDADVVAVTGQRIEDLFLDAGEAAFRDLEASAVGEALAGHDGVLSLGGGAVLRSQTRDLLRGQRVVFLSVSPGEAADRVGLSGARPVLGLNPRATLRTLLAERLPLYAEVATWTVDTTARPPEEVAADLLALLRPPSPPSPA